MKSEKNLLKGRYLIDQEIKTFYNIKKIGYDIKLNRRVRINCFHILTNINENQKKLIHEKFMKKVEIISKVSHPMIEEIYDHFILNNILFLVTKYTKMKNLEKVMKKRNQIAEDIVKKLLVLIIDGLEELYENNFIPKYITPENIYINNNGQPVLDLFHFFQNLIDSICDFSIVHSDLVYSSLPVSGFKKIDFEATKVDNIYSLAVLGYYLCSKKVPQYKAVRRMSDELIELKDISDISKSMNKTIMKGLKLKKEETFKKIKDFKKALL